MRLSRIFVDSALEMHSVIALPKESAHYISNVLRLRIEDELLVFNAQHGEFLARIRTSTKKLVEIELTELRRPAVDDSKAAGLSIRLLLGLSRGDRMDFAVQKATELGVGEICPVYTEYGEVRLKAERVEKKLQHWQKIAVGACEQSGRLDVPTVHKPMQLEESNLGDSVNRWMLEPTGNELFPESIENQNITLLIGPEGGFSPTEVEWAQENSFRIVALGSRILRTETAPVAALAILQHKFGDM